VGAGRGGAELLPGALVEVADSAVRAVAMDSLGAVTVAASTVPVGLTPSFVWNALVAAQNAADAAVASAFAAVSAASLAETRASATDRVASPEPLLQATTVRTTAVAAARGWTTASRVQGYGPRSTRTCGQRHEG